MLYLCHYICVSEVKSKTTNLKTKGEIKMFLANINIKKALSSLALPALFAAAVAYMLMAMAGSANAATTTYVVNPSEMFSGIPNTSAHSGTFDAGCVTGTMEITLNNPGNTINHSSPTRTSVTVPAANAGDPTTNFETFTVTLSGAVEWEIGWYHINWPVNNSERIHNFSPAVPVANMTVAAGHTYDGTALYGDGSGASANNRSFATWMPSDNVTNFSFDVQEDQLGVIGFDTLQITCEDTDDDGIYDNDEASEADINDPCSDMSHPDWELPEGVDCTDTDGDGIYDSDEAEGEENDPCSDMTNEDWMVQDSNDCDEDGTTVGDGDSDDGDSCVDNAVIVAGDDCDEDGAEDAGEEDAGTDPTNPDTDGDGILDGDENPGEGNDPCLDPAHADWMPQDSNDCDEDGLTYAEEQVLGTSDMNPDSDGGGVSDGDEVANGTDPAVAGDDTEAEEEEEEENNQLVNTGSNTTTAVATAVAITLSAVAVAYITKGGKLHNLRYSNSN